MPDYREATINAVWDTGEAYIWCSKRTWDKLLVRRGWTPTKHDATGVWFTVPLAAISIRSRRSIGAKRRNLTRNLPARTPTASVV